MTLSQEILIFPNLADDFTGRSEQSYLLDANQLKGMIVHQKCCHRYYDARN